MKEETSRGLTRIKTGSEVAWASCPCTLGAKSPCLNHSSLFQPEFNPRSIRVYPRLNFSQCTKPWHALILFVLMLVSPMFTQSQSTYDRLDRAAELIRQQQLESAETELNSILHSAPRNPNALNLLGVIRAQQKRLGDAERLFLRASQLSPGMLGPYLNLGRLYLEQGNTEKSLLAFIRAAQLAPNDVGVNQNLASLYVEKRDFEHALSYLTKIPRASWEVDQLQLAVSCYLSLGRKAEALALITPNTDSFTPDEASAFASLFLKHNIPDAALRILTAVNQATPNSYQVLFLLGATYAQMKDWDRAEEFCTSALSAKPDDIPALLALARIARTRGEFEKSLAHLMRARKLEPDNLTVLYDFGVTALQMDLVLDALPVFERLQALRPNEPAYLYMLAVTCYRHDEKNRAETLLRRYIKLRPNEPIGYYMLGETLYSVKRYTEARPVLEQSLKLGLTVDSEYLLGLIADNDGQTEQALRRFQSVLQSTPLHAGAHTALGTIYAKQSNYTQAKVELERAVELNPRDLRAFYQLGLVYAKLGDREQAKKMLDRADQLRDEQRNQESVGLKLIDPPQ